MKKKIYFSIILFTSILMFSLTCCFAENMNNGGQEVVNGIRNAVGGAENVMEDTATGIVNGIKNGTSSLENSMNDNMNTTNMMDNNNNSTRNMNSDASNYTATRTATTDTTVAGLDANTWMWIAIIAAIIGIVALVWSFIRDNNTRNYYND